MTKKEVAKIHSIVDQECRSAITSAEHGIYSSARRSLKYASQAQHFFFTVCGRFGESERCANQAMRNRIMTTIAALKEIHAPIVEDLGVEKEVEDRKRKGGLLAVMNSCGIKGSDGKPVEFVKHDDGKTRGIGSR